MGKGWSYEKRGHFFSQYYRARCLRSRIKSRAYSGELKAEATVIMRGKDRTGITVQEEPIASALGEKPCWVKFEIKGTTLYKQYRPGVNTFHLPRGPPALAKPGEKLEVKIRPVTLEEFVQRAIKESPIPFNIQADKGNYYLIVRNERIPLSLAMDMHFERGGKEPAVIFGIIDYLGTMHGIKISHCGYRKPSMVFRRNIEGSGKIDTSDYRKIAGITCDRKIEKLEIEYYDGRTLSTSTIWLKEPEFKESAELKVWFTEVSPDMVKGVVSPECFAEIDWRPKADANEKGIFGTEIETAFLSKQGMRVISRDLSGRNDSEEYSFYNFDVMYFDEKGNLCVEEVKLVTSERSRSLACKRVDEKLSTRLNSWNSLPDKKRKYKDELLPKVDKGHVVAIRFDPHTGEFTRESAGWVHLRQESSLNFQVNKN